MATPRTFEIEPPPQITVMMLGATAALPLFGVLILIAVLGRGGMRMDIALAIAVALFASAMTAVFVVITLRRRAIELTSTHLVLKAGLFTRRVPIERLGVHDARIAMLGDQPDARPRVKLLGVRLPGYRAGWFLMRDGSRAFLITTAGRSLRLPVRDAAALLLTPAQPDTLLAALRDVAATQHPR